MCGEHYFYFTPTPYSAVRILYCCWFFSRFLQKLCESNCVCALRCARSSSGILLKHKFNIEWHLNNNNRPSIIFTTLLYVVHIVFYTFGWIMQSTKFVDEYLPFAHTPMPLVSTAAIATPSSSMLSKFEFVVEKHSSLQYIFAEIVCSALVFLPSIVCTQLSGNESTSVCIAHDAKAKESQCRRWLWAKHKKYFVSLCVCESFINQITWW